MASTWMHGTVHNSNDKKNKKTISTTGGFSGFIINTIIQNDVLLF